MKSTLTFLLFLILSFWADAQITQEDDSNTSYKTSKERLWFSFGAGPRIHQFNPGVIKTFLLSETEFSNGIGQFVGIERMENPIVLTGYQAKMSYTQAIGLNHSILLDITFGNNRAYFGGYSVGWEIPLSRKKINFNVQPGFAFLLGYTQFYIGELSRKDTTGYNDRLIQIGNVPYFNSELELFMTQDVVGYVYGPELAFHFIPDYSNTAFQFSVSYYWGSAGGDAVIIFDPIGKSNNGLAESSSLNVNSPVLSVYDKNNVPVQKNLFNYDGLRCTVSITFDF